MDSSSLGLADQFDKFQNTHQDLQRALKAIVNGNCSVQLERKKC
jgi:exocyst complex component 4